MQYVKVIIRIIIKKLSISNLYNISCGRKYEKCPKYVLSLKYLAVIEQPIIERTPIS